MLKFGKKCRYQYWSLRIDGIYTKKYSSTMFQRTECMIIIILNI
uniref:Uncharacterized protein n=1 Tax=Meloidogyne enterolobii TaxID=390850 RepID=A0A6V7VU74_MELEN|nr:unnamed protein product [Meloidogyne enterolobii]